MGRAARPNDPCPCGSGLKFKKCCDRPAGAAKPASAGYTAAERASALEKLLPLFDDPRFADEEEDAFAELWGVFADREDELSAELRGASEAVLDAWFGFDYRLDDETVVVDHLLEDKRLTAGERAYLRAMQASSMRLYEVTATAPGTSMTLRDVVEGTTITVNERSASRTMARHDLLVARVVARGYSGGPEMDLGVLSIVDALRDELVEAIEEMKADYPENTVDEIYKAMPPIFHEAWLSSIFEPAIPELRTTDDELLLLTRVSFEVGNAARVVKALAGASKRGIEPARDRSWRWAGPNRNGELTSLGTIKLEGQTLILETHSAERGERGRSLLEELAGEHLRYVSTTHEDLRAQIMEGMTASALRGAPLEAPAGGAVDPAIAAAMVADFQEAHYRAWVDQPVPALDGKTPREASTDPSLRERLVRLIEDLERSNARALRAGQPGYDPSWMWNELGLR